MAKGRDCFATIGGSTRTKLIDEGNASDVMRGTATWLTTRPGTSSKAAVDLGEPRVCRGIETKHGDSVAGDGMNKIQKYSLFNLAKDADFDDVAISA